MRECSIEQIEQDGFDVLRINGSLDSFSFPKLEDALAKLRETERHRVILDCSGLNYISSVALGALIGFSRRARENGGDLLLAQLSPKVFNIIELLGFNRILAIHETREQAVQAFAS